MSHMSHMRILCIGSAFAILMCVSCCCCCCQVIRPHISIYRKSTSAANSQTPTTKSQNSSHPKSNSSYQQSKQAVSVWISVAISQATKNKFKQTKQSQATKHKTSRYQSSKSSYHTTKSIITNGQQRSSPASPSSSPSLQSQS